MRARLISLIILSAAGIIGFSASFMRPEWYIGIIPAIFIFVLSLFTWKDFSRYWFYTLCAGEVCVVAIGGISLLLALLVQTLLLFALIIPDGSLQDTDQIFGFALFLVGAFVLTMWITPIHHMVSPAIILSAIALVTIFIISLQEYKLKRKFEGSA